MRPQVSLPNRSVYAHMPRSSDIPGSGHGICPPGNEFPCEKRNQRFGGLNRHAEAIRDRGNS
ncbi:hypothetical protein [Desulfonema ishimotonii]|uniref:hypothetical protein n=1 Tax=Desulfonema ishimotonii TaxID=45657 RepID=UPI000F55A16D|nr:hypothetical protein [Desulfonema ishimotonii]